MPAGWDCEGGGDVEGSSHFVDGFDLDGVTVADTVISGSHLHWEYVQRRYTPPPDSRTLIWWNTEYSRCFAAIFGYHWFDKVRYMVGVEHADHAAQELPALLSNSSHSLRTLEVRWDGSVVVDFQKPLEFTEMLTKVVITHPYLTRLIISDVPFTPEGWSHLASLRHLQTLEISFCDSLLNHTPKSASFPRLRKLRCRLINDCDAHGGTHPSEGSGRRASMHEACYEQGADSDASRYLEKLTDVLAHTDLTNLRTFDLCFWRFDPDLEDPDDLKPLFAALARTSSTALEHIVIGEPTEKPFDIPKFDIDTLQPLYALTGLRELVIYGAVASSCTQHFLRVLSNAWRGLEFLRLSIDRTHTTRDTLERLDGCVQYGERLKWPEYDFGCPSCRTENSPPFDGLAFVKRCGCGCDDQLYVA